MTELSVLERVRAAVAEAGYDPRLILAPSEPWAHFNVSRRLPLRVAWKAHEAVQVGKVQCFACTEATLDQAQRRKRPEAPPCLADRRFVEDCGRDRNEP